MASKKIPKIVPKAGPRAPQVLQHRARAKPVTASASAESPKRPGFWIFTGAAIFGGSLYGSYLYNSYVRDVEYGKTLNVSPDTSYRYSETAPEFDSVVEQTEWLMGLLSLRKSLAKEAKGDVLEVSVGTGRNLEYLDLASCRSLTLVDASKEMMEEARKKFRKLHPRYENISFVVSDGASPSLAKPGDGYDTIIQTMGLCSTARTTDLLRNMARLCNPQTGRIILLEHGRSKYGFLNDILDGLAPTHAIRHGCWWNKDLHQIVEESGLEIVEIKRYHLGTTWWIELKPQLTETTGSSSTS